MLYIGVMEESVVFVRPASEEWDAYRKAFMEAQCGLCAICGQPVTDPQLDHCHDTGFVRGVLCPSCNTKLGWYEGRRQAIETYLARAGEFQAHQQNTGRKFPELKTTPRLSRSERLRQHYLAKTAS